jgi:glucose-1-phosphate thymidylyltransferase
MIRGMRGIILAGGSGTRLWPITKVTSKQLLPLYDKPLIYYPISTLMHMGIQEILIITTPHDAESFRLLLGDGSNFGINLSYAIQEKPEGLAQAFIIGEDFIGDGSCTLILGDNFFHWNLGDEPENIQSKLSGAKIYGYKVKDPTQYGVIEIDIDGHPISIEEKPDRPKSDIAVTGLYSFDNRVVEVAKNVKPSKRGEFEITSVIDFYLQRGELELSTLPRGTAWLDTGTPELMLNAASYVHIIESRTGQKISCPEEIAFTKNWLSREQMIEIVASLKNNAYANYLENLINSNKD